MGDKAVFLAPVNLKFLYPMISVWGEQAVATDTRQKDVSPAHRALLFFRDAVGGAHDNVDAVFSRAAGGNRFCVKVNMACLCASAHVRCHFSLRNRWSALRLAGVLGMVSRGLGSIFLAPLALSPDSNQPHPSLSPSLSCTL